MARPVVARREGFIVRIRRHGGDEPVGVGFVVGERHIVTCAHVVNAALGRDEGERGAPDSTARVQVDFPLLGDAEGAPLRNCRVAAWEPPIEAGRAGRDVAGLVLVGGDTLPEGAAPARLVDARSPHGLEVDFFGYPGSPPRTLNGGWSACRLRGAVGGGLVQLDVRGESALRAQPGYSGAPAVVRDEWGDAVVGLLITASRAGGAGDAYAVPIAEVAAAWPDVLAGRAAAPCPYRGLQAFTAADADAGLFVGREDEVVELRGMVRDQPLTVVVGPSGVGKSSLVAAGLLPALRADGWSVASFRPGSTPFDALARALLDVERPGGGHSLEELDERAARVRRDGLWQTATRLAVLTGRRVALVADQFEEALAADLAEDGPLFLDRVLPAAAASGGSSDVRLVCALRADFLPALLDLPGIGRKLRGRQLNLSPMDVPTLTRVITEPAAARGVGYAPDLAGTIARDASRGRGGLPLLEFTLTELWAVQRDGRLDFDGYHALGGVAGALNRHAERVYGALSAEVDPARIRRALLAMVRSRDGAVSATRAVVRRAHLGDDWAVAEALARPANRLVVLGSDGPGTAEIAHEALIREWTRLASWVDEDARFQRWLTVMEERAEEGEVLSDVKVEEARQWLAERPADIPSAVVRLISRSWTAVRRRIRELERERQRTEDLLAESRRLTAELRRTNAELEDKARQIAEVSAYRSQFIANLSHEFRTPLNSLIVLADLLARNRDGTFTGKEVEYARTILSCGQDVLQLVDDLLDIGSIESGHRPPPAASEIPLADVLSRVEELIGPLAAEKGLDFSLTIDDGVPDAVVTDSSALWQILRNLLSNAIKFTHRGGVAVRFGVADGDLPDVEALRSAGRVLAIAVSDTGVGVPAEEVDAIFAAFRQVEGAANRRYGGAGVGLAISRELAAAIGGAIAVESAPGAGSTFTLYLPDVMPDVVPSTLPDAAAARTAERPARPSAPRRARRLDGATILVINSDLRNAFALVSALELHGAHVVCADSGVAGVEALAEHPDTDLVLVSRAMPEVDGLTTTSAIRADPRFARLPVVVLSAVATPADRQRAIAAGAGDYLLQPVGLDDLLDAVEALLADASG
ncbi:ATP-binding protein [Saccharothrix sp. HUAS TT1]|uniref:nSTAND1 domain-containing NTPase n=1 Tax=unclassified Saccharothrix TaxID=2593673 RepID=UPI00345C2C2D